MDVEIRPVTAEELPAFIPAVSLAFGDQPSAEEVSGWAVMTDPTRTLAAFDGDTIVATAGIETMELTVPGEVQLGVAGITAVSVRPTHRRRGLLSQLMTRQLDDVAAAGEPVAILTASESGIYRRFGYGIASYQVAVALETRFAAFSRPLEDQGRVEILDKEAARRELPAIHDRARRIQTGDISRREAWWDIACDDPEWARRDGGPSFFAVHRDATGEVGGWTTYRIERSWPDGIAHNVAHIGDLGATDPRSEAALWRFLLDLDLVSEVRSPKRPTDEALRHRLSEPRRLRTTTLRDDLWLRILDVPAALGARRYLIDGELVLEVVDPFRPRTDGRYLLVGGPSGAECTPTDRPADLSLDISTLGTAYLGLARFGLQEPAGLVTELRPGALRQAEIMFRGSDVPFCRTPF
jgi:predicted acetyltransferase